MKKSSKCSGEWLGLLNVKTGVRRGYGLTLTEAKKIKKKNLRNGAFIKKDLPDKVYYFKSIEKVREWQAKGKKQKK